MMSTLFILSYILGICIILYISYKSTVNLMIPTIPSIFLWSYILNAIIGILPLYFMWNEYRVNLGINNQTQVAIMFGYSILAILTVILTWYFLSKKANLQLLHMYPEPEQGENTKIVNMIFISAFAISIIVTMLYLIKIPYIPVIELLKGASAKELAEYRSLVTNGFEGKLHWYRLFYSQVPMFVSFYAFSNLLIKKSRFNFIFFISTFIFTSFSLFISIQKAPVAWYFIGLFITFLITKRIKLKLSSLLVLGSFLSIILVLMYKFVMGMQNRAIFEIIKTISSRVFTGQIGPSYFYLDMFPNQQEFLLGSSFPNPMGIMPWEPVSITILVMKYMQPNLDEDIIGSAPTAYWAELYANFGLGGIILGSIFVGFVLYVLQYLLFRLKFSPIIISYIVWSILFFQALSSSGFGRYLFNIDFIIITFITLCALLFSKDLVVTYKGKDVFDYFQKIIYRIKRMVNNVS